MLTTKGLCPEVTNTWRMWPSRAGDPVSVVYSVTTLAGWTRIAYGLGLETGDVETQVITPNYLLKMFCIPVPLLESQEQGMGGILILVS
jgi:hypothetical protein